MTIKNFLKILAFIVIACGIILGFYLLVERSYIKPDKFITITSTESKDMNKKISHERTITFYYPDAKLTDSAISVTEISEGEAQINVQNGEAYGSLPVPIKDDFVFSGWYTSKWSGERILSSDIVELNKADFNNEESALGQELYAHWISEEKAQESELPILMYHWFYEEENIEPGMLSNSNWMDIEEFRSHMEYLKEEDYYYPSWEEVGQYVDGVLALPEKSIVINIDDGKKDFFELAIPVLNENDVHATGFIITSKIKDDKLEKYKYDNIEYRSHSHNMHVRQSGGLGKIYSMEVYEIVGDLHKSKEILGQGDVFCYPFGHVSDNAKEALEIEGYKIGVTTRNARANPGMDKLELPRVRMSSGTTVDMFKKLIGEDVSESYNLERYNNEF